jgi:hypothetical protein
VRPYAIEIAEREAASWGLKALLPAIAANSARVQHIEAKGKMEACRRDNPTLAGICHFNAMDTGPSPQGIVNEFYGLKHADAAAWRRTNGDAVVLADRGFADRVLVGGGHLRCMLSVSDFSHPPLRRPRLEWRLAAGVRALARGRIEYRHRPFFTCAAGRAAAELPRVRRPVRATLSVELREGGRSFDNEWDFWIMPADVALPACIGLHGSVRDSWLRTLPDLKRMGPGDVALTEAVDAELLDCVRRGGRALLAAGEGLVRPFHPKLGLVEGRYFFTPPANYPPYDAGHEGTIIAPHPMLGRMPHEGFADLQFYRMMGNAPPLDLAALGAPSAQPVIRAVSAPYDFHPLAWLAEFRLGRGGLIVSALDLDQRCAEARYLLACILRYAASDRFAPRQRLPQSGVDALLHAAAVRGDAR